MIDDIYQCTHLFTDNAGVKATLAKYGVAIIPSILDASKCAQTVDQIWDYFEHVSTDWPVPARRDDPSTWRHIPDNMFLSHGQLLQWFEGAHSQAAWDLRQNPALITPFAEIWSCAPEDLLVSFDGFSFAVPPEQRGNKGFERDSWFHCDTHDYTNKKGKQYKCIQSWVTPINVAPGDGTLVVMEGSHVYHDEVRDALQKARAANTSSSSSTKFNWYKMDQRQVVAEYERRGCFRRRIVCPPGSMVLWDSHTLHYGGAPLRGRANQTPRCVVYLCYKPRAQITKSNLAKRLRYFADKRGTNHDPCDVRVFPVEPHTYGKPIAPMRPVPPPVLTPLGRRLVGFTDTDEDAHADASP